ncbi:MAG: hypothetical protein ACI8UO_006115 [Verrucomicrobiales bacterium]|jgi:hypothetical protein
MKLISVAALLLSLLSLEIIAAEPSRHWPLESIDSSSLTLRGSAAAGTGIDENQALVLDGISILEVPDSAALTHGDAGFSLTIWVNPYAIGGEQQMIAAKNRYSKNEREWSVMIDKDGLVCLYLRQGGWKTVRAPDKPTKGRWLLVGLTVNPQLGMAELWIDGKSVGALKLDSTLPQTKAPLTFGGVNDGGRNRQTLFGALDDIRLFERPLSAEEMAALYRPVEAAHAIPEALKKFTLRDEALPFPATAEIEVLDDAEFHVIKKWEPEDDGYQWLHGVGLAWHQGKLYASFGHNVGKENTLTEEGRYMVSDDGGATWSDPETIDVGTDADDLAVSHGVFLSHEGKLWAFLGAFHGSRQRVHTRAYTLDENTGEWAPRGVVVEGGFWPMQEPVKMEDGNWILPGFIVGNGNPAAVAISEGDDLMKWKLVVIPKRSGVGTMWGESSIIVDGPRILSIARYGARSLALAAISEDFGRTWTPSVESNLPMATSKPASGMLSTGQRYLVCSTTSDGGGRRSPLTIAVSRSGEAAFSKVYVVRHAEFPDGPGESDSKAGLSYPYTIEHDGKLYIGYSNSGGRRGNHNSAELAVVPVASLTVPEPKED